MDFVHQTFYSLFCNLPFHGGCLALLSQPENFFNTNKRQFYKYKADSFDMIQNALEDNNMDKASGLKEKRCNGEC